ncbi:hypothetical protein [Schauerella aestuarii]|uniref:hypothetical protein n=1 Tax=Schauerella aestuarii TaxID=2511204 RepID=UPI00136B8BE1|nr:hypothetical protein [Achromobacter aestuarii]MYZ41424.1 hypothetical protein [Achromobacter aestuarii]
MATPAFPSYACIQLDGYSESPNYGVIRSDMDGLAKQRRRWTKPIVTRTVKLRLRDKYDKAVFETWFRTAIFGGTGWFTFTDPVDGLSKQGRFVGGAISWTSPGVIWFAQAQIETIG